MLYTQYTQYNSPHIHVSVALKNERVYKAKEDRIYDTQLVDSRVKL
jgi:hypothetical protein